MFIPLFPDKTGMGYKVSKGNFSQGVSKLESEIVTSDEPMSELTPNSRRTYTDFTPNSPKSYMKG